MKTDDPSPLIALLFFLWMLSPGKHKKKIAELEKRMDKYEQMLIPGKDKI